MIDRMRMPVFLASLFIAMSAPYEASSRTPQEECEILRAGPVPGRIGGDYEFLKSVGRTIENTCDPRPTKPNKVQLNSAPTPSEWRSGGRATVWSRRAPTAEELVLRPIDAAAQKERGRSIEPLPERGPGCWSFSAQSPLDGARLAFVAGVSNYNDPRMRLTSPASDALVMSQQLLLLGFNVVLSLDQSQESLRECVETASKQAGEAAEDINLVFFSGHGLQRNDENFLVAADFASGTRGADGLISLSELTSPFTSGDGSLIVLLDACRDNPDGATGLAPVGIRGKGLTAVAAGTEAGGAETSGATAAASLYIAYATAPNTVAYDGQKNLSPFTEALSANLLQKGWPLDRVMASVRNAVGELTNWSQTPWVRSSLRDVVYLNGQSTFDEIVLESNNRAKLSRNLLAKGLHQEAALVALSAIPDGLSDKEIEQLADANSAFVRAYFAESTQIDFPYTGDIRIEVNKNAERILTGPSGALDEQEFPVAIWDRLSGELLKKLEIPRDGAELDELQFVGRSGFFFAGYENSENQDPRVDVFDPNGDFAYRIDPYCVHQEFYQCNNYKILSTTYSPLLVFAHDGTQRGARCLEVWNIETAKQTFFECDRTGVSYVAAAVSAGSLGFAIISKEPKDVSLGKGEKISRLRVIDEFGSTKLDLRLGSSEKGFGEAVHFSSDGRLLGVKIDPDVFVFRIEDGRQQFHFRASQLETLTLTAVLTTGEVLVHSDDELEYVLTDRGPIEKETLATLFCWESIFDKSARHLSILQPKQFVGAGQCRVIEFDWRFDLPRFRRLLTEYSASLPADRAAALQSDRLRF